MRKGLAVDIEQDGEQITSKAREMLDILPGRVFRDSSLLYKVFVAVHFSNSFVSVNKNL